MISLPGVLSAALEVEQFCKQRGWRFCFIGGIAVQRWGQPRLTQDVDLTIVPGLDARTNSLTRSYEPFMAAGRTRGNSH